jgi:hypothetical protein
MNLADAATFVEERPAGAGASSRRHHIGGDDAFIYAWGRSNEALRSRARNLVLSMGLNLALGATVAFLAWRNERKETYVFVKNPFTGELIQADPNSFLRAGDQRTELEVKSFMRRWVVDAFSWTPLDVKDRLRAALRVVDPSVHAIAKNGMRLGERQGLVDNGTSGRVDDDPTTDKTPQAVIVRSTPLEVLVSFERHLVNSDGSVGALSPMIVRATLKPVPRAPSNWGYGLVITDLQISEKL